MISPLFLIFADLYFSWSVCYGNKDKQFIGADFSKFELKEDKWDWDFQREKCIKEKDRKMEEKRVEEALKKIPKKNVKEIAKFKREQAFDCS